MKRKSPMRIDGKLVVDAPKSIAITITKADVRNGNTKDPGSCAAARACLNLPHVTKARVHLGRTYILKGNKWIRYLTPASLRGEIVAFDRGGTFAPGKYTLTKSTPWQTFHKGKQQGSTKGQTNPRHKQKKRPYHVTTGVRVHGAAR